MSDIMMIREFSARHCEADPRDAVAHEPCEAPSAVKRRMKALKRKRNLFLWVFLFAALLVTGTPMLVNAKHRLQEWVSVSAFMLQPGNYLQKKRILKVLSQTDLTQGHARIIARTVIEESRKHDIPASLFLAIMKKESNFNVYARSPVNAMGVMQIHPVTWDAYAKKLNLEASRKHAFEPALNIMVSAALLNDLRDRYAKWGLEENLLWDYILAAYYAGGESLKSGLNKNHRYYVKKVREYDIQISSAL